MNYQTYNTIIFIFSILHPQQTIIISDIAILIKLIIKYLQMLGLLMFVLRVENDEDREARIAARNAMQLRRQQIRDTSNPFTLPEEMFRMHYR